VTGVNGYTTEVVAEVLAIPPSRLRYWESRGLFRPSVQPGRGKGTRKLFSFLDIVEARAVQTLREEAGLSLQKIRRCVAYLRKHESEILRPLATLTFVTDGLTLFRLAPDRKALVDLGRGGQLLFAWPIGKAVEEIRERVAEMSMPTRERVTIGQFSFEVEFRPDAEDGGYVVECLDIPGCLSQGEDLDEARAMIRDAIETVMELAPSHARGNRRRAAR
jgi:predicted RNase H-like HicB family nuclease